MPKSVRIYYEQTRKQKLMKELAEYARLMRERELEETKLYNGKE
jgi:uncharacterized protein YjcR